MEKSKIVRWIVYIIFIILAIVFAFHSNKNIDKKNQEILSLEKKLETKNKEYDNLYEEKNGNANRQLVIATKGVFTSIFNYDTEKDSIKDRMKKASKFTTEKALKDIFPNEKASYNTSVKTTSKLKEDPKIYYSATSKNVQKVLIIVENETSIQGSEKLSAKFMYEAEFDPIKNVFISLKNAGTLNE